MRPCRSTASSFIPRASPPNMAMRCSPISCVRPGWRSKSGAELASLPDPGFPLDQQTSYETFAAILDGAFDDDAIALFLTAMAERDETSSEIAGAALAMRERMMTISAPEGAIDV